MATKRIQIRQFIILIIMFTLGSSILLTPAFLSIVAKQDAWLSGIGGVAFGLLAVYIFAQLAIAYPQQTIVEYSSQLLGRVIGKILAFFYLGFLYILAGLLLENMGFFIISQIVPETPIQAVYIFFMLVVLLALYYGMESVARTAELFFPIYFLIFVIPTLFIIPEIELENLKPMLEEGFKPIFHGSLLFFAFPFSELSALLMLTSQVGDKKKLVKAFLIGTLTGGVALIIVIFLTLTVLGPKITAHQTFPPYILAMKVNIGFLSGVEVLMATIWLVGLSIKMVLCFYAVVVGLNQLLRLKGNHTLTLPLTVLLIVLTLYMVPSQMYLLHVNQASLWTFEISMGMLYPLLLWICHLFKKKAQ